MRMPVVMILGVVLMIGSSMVSQAAESAPDKASETAKAEKEWPTALDFKMKTLEGEEVHLAEKYEGKVVLFVNVASRCGYTPQYEGLQALHEKYGEQGLAIVGVPCNQFGGQEPGTSEQIAQFCEANYGVEFDMLGKVNVKRSEDDQCPLYKYLTDEEKLPGIGSDIKWNFEKFVIGRDGKPIAHYRSKTAPESEELTKTIEEALAAKTEE
ncbi:glutathione peroxidase [Aeoliella mucimassa]|uniref:Glutathione peroxidase n=1 Tax=Aeoliella mucimassa TaxID=2527972 RepID=A0A518ATL3_9BACT|nr:glutathione peroxidase [Aeoliella mucimassa]QDU58072.1 Hydroperoxy fatty acid reductase gpx2 [Aeoliella mucimassa]